jgi:hypothetical protein
MQPKSNATSRCAAVLVGATLTAFSEAAVGQPRPEAPAPTSPVTLEVQTAPRSMRWSFALVNGGPAPVDVVVDRNLLSVEITRPVTSGARARRRARSVVCRSALHSPVTEGLPRRTLAPGERHREGFDLQALCGVKLPSALARGATLVWRYGSQRGRPSWSRAVVLAGESIPIVELRAEPVEFALDPEDLDPPAAEQAAASLRVRAQGNVSGDRGADVLIRASLEGVGPSPRRMYFRPSMFSVELLSPRGTRVHCVDAPSGYVGLPEDLRTVTAGHPVRATLSLGALCPSGVLDEPGIYRGWVRFDSRVDPNGRLMFTHVGALRSAPFWIAVRRGRPGRAYAPLDAAEPFSGAGTSP